MIWQNQLVQMLTFRELHHESRFASEPLSVPQRFCVFLCAVLCMVFNNHYLVLMG